MKLNKYVAHCGLCSRRKAAELIKAGKVRVNDRVETAPAYEVQETDVVKHEGQVLTIVEEMHYLLLNKPKNYVTTLSDEQDRKTVMDLVAHKVKHRIYPVGRLDMFTTGLLLFTNDGELAKKLMHPSNGVKKIYQIVLQTELEQKDFDQIAAGIELDDGPIKVDNISYVKDAPKTTIGIEIHVGRNRIVRRIFEHFNYSIVTLDRVYFGGLTKKDLPRGRTRPLTEEEIRMLKYFV